VLLIDDDPLQLRVREAVLREAGLRVDVATTAETALALLRTGSGDSIATIVTDHIMPGTSGAVFVHKLREFQSSSSVAWRKRRAITLDSTSFSAPSRARRSNSSRSCATAFILRDSSTRRSDSDLNAR